MPILTNFIGNYKESRQSAGILQRRNIMKEFIVKDKDGKLITIKYENERIEKLREMIEEMRKDYKHTLGSDVECI